MGRWIRSEAEETEGFLKRTQVWGVKSPSTTRPAAGGPPSPFHGEDMKTGPVVSHRPREFIEQSKDYSADFSWPADSLPERRSRSTS